MNNIILDYTRYLLWYNCLHLVHWNLERKSYDQALSALSKSLAEYYCYKEDNESYSNSNPNMRLGKTHLEIASRWLPSAMAYGATAGLGVLYFTDWKAVLQYLPYWNGKYKQ